jgi:hypothetical protein
MPVNLRITKFIPVALATAAVAVPAGIVAQSIGASGTAATAGQPIGAHVDPGRLCTTTNQRGYPNAVPPILPPPLCSKLVAIRREESFEGQEFWNDPPATARYSKAEINAYPTKSK